MAEAREDKSHLQSELDLITAKATFEMQALLLEKGIRNLLESDVLHKWAVPNAKGGRRDSNPLIVKLHDYWMNMILQQAVFNV